MSNMKSLLAAALALSVPSLVNAETDDWQMSGLVYVYVPTIDGETAYPASPGGGVSIDAGSLLNLEAAFMGFARRGNVDGLRAYLRSEAFMAAINGLDPRRRRSAMHSYAAAEALCEAKAPLRHVKPKPIHAKRAQKTSWGNPIMRAKLADA